MHQGIRIHSRIADEFEQVGASCQDPTITAAGGRGGLDQPAERPWAASVVGGGQRSEGAVEQGQRIEERVVRDPLGVGVGEGSDAVLQGEHE